MPLQLRDIDVIPHVAGLSSVLIVPCNMCPAVSVAVKKKRPFIQLFRHFLKSAPYEQHIKALQSRLGEAGLETKVFNSRLPNQWFLCMWTSGRRKKLERSAKHYDAVIVLGCDSATETVRDSVKSAGCKVIQGMEVVGLTNAKPKFSLPCNVSFEGGEIVPIAQRHSEENSRS